MHLIKFLLDNKNCLTALQNFLLQKKIGIVKKTFFNYFSYFLNNFNFQKIKYIRAPNATITLPEYFEDLLINVVFLENISHNKLLNNKKPFDYHCQQYRCEFCSFSPKERNVFL